MKSQPYNVILINFENADSINVLLRNIGIEQDFGQFVARHLDEVLRKQHSDVLIESIELLNTHNCNIGGMQGSDRSVLNVDSIRIPFEINAIVATSNEKHSLDLHVEIKANASDNGFNVESDVVIQHQSLINRNGDAASF